MTLSRSQLDALRDLEVALGDVPFVIVGATALAIHSGMDWRATYDLDVVVGGELEEFPFGLNRRSGWSQDPRRGPQRFVAPSGAQIDLVPAGPHLLIGGTLEWSPGVIMNLTGIELAFRCAATHDIDGQRVRVAPAPVIAILKMVAYLDRPADRGRDLQDLAHLCETYIAVDDERRWTDGRAAGHNDLVSAYLLGADLARIAERDRHVVDSFLAIVGDKHRHPYAQMERAGPISWDREHEPLGRRLRAFAAGWST